jgi:hypothetical protein
MPLTRRIFAPGKRHFSVPDDLCFIASVAPQPVFASHLTGRTAQKQPAKPVSWLL